MADHVTVRLQSPSYQAYEILHIAFTVAPIAAGIDKFTHFLVDWDKYLSPMVPRFGLSVHQIMMGVGVVEIIAGLLVAFAPRIGAWIVALWLFGIVVNLLSIPAYFDIALRDFGLGLGALALARLSEEYAS
jgi:D-alanyl-lipoteichoic acid acyltransferase DltB (MBOAT superfamily)